MPGKPEALLNHSTEKEAGREETQTFTLSVGAIQSPSLPLSRQREGEGELGERVKKEKV